MTNCEGKSLVIKVRQKVAACHAEYRSCYFERCDPAPTASRPPRNECLIRRPSIADVDLIARDRRGSQPPGIPDQPERRPERGFWILSHCC